MAGTIASTADPDRVIEGAGAVYDGAVAAGNSFAAWMSSEA